VLTLGFAVLGCTVFLPLRSLMAAGTGSAPPPSTLLRFNCAAVLRCASAPQISYGSWHGKSPAYWAALRPAMEGLGADYKVRRLGFRGLASLCSV
jgi:hypothetical protein